MRNLHRMLCCGIVSVLSLGAATSVHAVTTLDMYNITGNSVLSTNVGESQLKIDLSDLGGGEVLFQFRNAGPAQSTIATLYIDDLDGHSLLDDFDGFSYSGSGIEFKTGGSPGVLPGGNDPLYAFDVDHTFGAKSPAPHKGVNAGEWVGLTFELDDDYTFADLLTAIENQDLRLGMHVINFANGQSESYINVPPGDETPTDDPVPGVPEPLTAGSSLLALAVAALAAQRRRR